MIVPSTREIAATLTAVITDIDRHARTTLPVGCGLCEAVNTSDGLVAYITVADRDTVFARHPDWAYPLWRLHDWYDTETLCRLAFKLLASGGTRRLVDEWERLACEDEDEWGQHP